MKFFRIPVLNHFQHRRVSKVNLLEFIIIILLSCRFCQQIIWLWLHGCVAYRGYFFALPRGEAFADYKWDKSARLAALIFVRKKQAGASGRLGYDADSYFWVQNICRCTKIMWLSHLVISSTRYILFRTGEKYDPREARNGLPVHWWSEQRGETWYRAEVYQTGSYLLWNSLAGVGETMPERSFTRTQKQEPKQNRPAKVLASWNIPQTVYPLRPDVCCGCSGSL